MAKRQKMWAQTARFRLTFELGGACARCSSHKELDFDCITPQGDDHHRMDASARMCFYRRQHKERNVQILCKPCHRKKNVADLVRQREKEENEPF